MKITISPIVVNSQDSEQVEVRLVGHGPSASQLNIFYQFYDLLDRPIDGGAGNLFITNSYLDSTIDTALQTALEAAVGSVESWVLSFLSLYTNRARIEYVQSGITKHTLINFTISDTVNDSITSTVFSGLGVQKAIPAPLQLADSFNTIVGATTTEGNAVKAFVQALMDADVYLDMVAIYPFIGNTLAKKYRNLLDPADLDAAFRLTATTGTPTDDAKGIVLATSHGNILDTHISMPDVSQQPYIGAGTYLQNEPGRVVYGDALSYFTHTYRDSDGKCYPDIGAISSGFAIASGLKGHWNVQRIDIDNVEVRNQGTLKGTDSQHSLGLQDATIKLAVGFAGVDAQLSLFYIHRKLTSTKQTALQTAIQNFMTAISRNV